jgi:hypothetical protein
MSVANCIVHLTKYEALLGLRKHDPCALKILHILLCNAGERFFLHTVISASARENQALM